MNNVLGIRYILISDYLKKQIAIIVKTVFMIAYYSLSFADVALIIVRLSLIVYNTNLGFYSFMYENSRYFIIVIFGTQ